MQKRLKTRKIIIHHSASSKNTPRDLILQWHQHRGFSDIGYHFVISGATGEVEIGREESLVGAHTKDNNSDSIGICVTGNYENENLDHCAEKALLTLIKKLQVKYNLTWDNVTYHKKLNATLCPGKNLAFVIDGWKGQV